MYVVGSTGMGKSEFLKNMAIQDILAGRGIAFIDPHGDPSDEILDQIPPHRIKDVIYFDPSDLEYPIAFNIMEKVHYDYRHLITSGLLGVFKKIWGAEAWSGRMEYILNNTILALLEYSDSTLLGINRMMSVKSYRNKVVANLKDPIVKSFWVDEFAKYADRFATEATAAIQNKVGQFSSNNVIRNIVGQFHNKFDVRKIMDEGKILIVNVSKGKIGEDASRLLGALLITKIQLAAMSRVDTPEKERRDFYLYVDEFQNFATESFANILSEARKFHLSLTVAHQYIKQMEETVRDAVFGNVGTIVSFRVGAEDAEYLEKWFSPDFMMADIVGLGKYTIYLKLMIDGVSSKGFSSSTIAPYPKPERSYRDEIIQFSRQMYATPRAQVEDEVARWATSDGDDGLISSEVVPNDRRTRSAAPSMQKIDKLPSQDLSHAIKEALASPPTPRPQEHRPAPMQPSAPRPPQSFPPSQNRPHHTTPTRTHSNGRSENRPPIPSHQNHERVEKPAPLPQSRPQGISLDAALKSQPVDFKGRKITHEKTETSRPHVAPQPSVKNQIDIEGLRQLLEDTTHNK
jgi:hypothetical protein